MELQLRAVWFCTVKSEHAKNKPLLMCLGNFLITMAQVALLRIRGLSLYIAKQNVGSTVISDFFALTCY